MSTTPATPADLAALGHEVARLRRDRGMSIDALAGAAGVSRRTILNVEGATKAPRIDTLYAIASGLGVPLAQLVTTL